MSEETKKIELGGEGLYDARKLGVPKMLVLGVQHTFAMFGATVLGAHSDGYQRFHGAAVRGHRNAAVPSADKGQGAGVPRFQLAFLGG